MRGVRWQLARTFSRIDLLDLHGNRKKLEINPAGEIDEGVFTVDQGTAVAVMSRSPNAGANSAIRYAELWGSRLEKLTALESNDANSDGEMRRNSPERIQWQEHTPIAPFYFFSPRLQTESAEYWQAMKLTDVMPVNSTAAVTARDRFVVAHDMDELRTRLADLANPDLSDAVLRERYFRRTRSNRYPAGDTRGWRLSEARARLRAVSDLAAIPRPCQYRPFDRRWIAWADWLIDWPRSEIMRHMLERDNVALIARRQSPASRPGDYVFVADGLIIDGLIRSDNRGSESFFPLYLSSAAPGEPVLGERSELNFSPAFLDQLGRALAPSALDSTNETQRPDLPPAPAIFGFIYAQLQSREYGRRFGESLQIDFPRIFLPTGRAVFDTPGRNRRTIDLHPSFARTRTRRAIPLANSCKRRSSAPH
ncbi:MAG: type ISP restriction/modification enzyme [Pirellulaceae bacterium]